MIEAGIIEAIAYALKIVGVLFILIAAVGVLRLPDAFTRMHAATKAGTLGAGLVVLGSALSVSGAEAVGLAVVTAIVLLATVPLASHLLARAAYTSGAPFWAGTASDALEGTLARGDVPGEAIVPETGIAAATPSKPLAIERIVVAPTHGSRGRAAGAAHRLAEQLGVPLAVVGLIDGRALTDARSRSLARERLEGALDAARHAGGAAIADIAIDEGAPDRALLARLRPGDLTVLPPAGWFDHDVADPDAVAGEPRSGRAESLLPLAHAMPRLVLLAGDEDDVRRVVVLDDGTPAIDVALATLAALDPFPGAAVRVTWPAGETMTPERRAALAAASERIDLGFQAPTGAAGAVRDPGDVLVCRRVPGAARGDWYGSDWRDRIAPGWRGTVLLV